MPYYKVTGAGDNHIRLILAQGCLAHEAAEDGAGFDSERLASLNVLASVADYPIMAGKIWYMLTDEGFFRELLTGDEDLVEVGEEL